jgi:hypothetical protein
MDSYFRHPSGDPLAYTVGTSDTGIATAAMTGATLRVTAVGAGTATITVVATDPDGRSATQRFAVTVEDDDDDDDDEGGGGGGFDIAIQYHSSATAALQSAIGGAASTWESIVSATDFTDATVGEDLTCSLVGLSDTVPAGTSIDDILIIAGVAAIDGSTRPSVIAVATICAIRETSRTPAIGVIVFDSADLDFLDSVGLAASTAVHEVGHVLGIGLSSSWSGLLQGTSGSDPHFAGTLATAAFDAAGGTSYSGAKVPVQSSGDTGHWRESVLDTEVTTPVLDGASDPLSAITIQALADMGYSVDTSQADAFTLPSGAAADLAGPVPTVALHGDFIHGPIKVIDADGNIVRVIPPPPQPPANPRQPPARSNRPDGR